MGVDARAPRPSSAESTTSAAAPSVMPEELPAVTVPVSSLKTGGQLGEPGEVGVGARVLVRDELDLALPARHLHRKGLGREPALVPGARRPLLAAQGEGVLLLAGDAVLLGQGLGGLAHELARQRAEEAVLVHAVDRRPGAPMR